MNKVKSKDIELWEAYKRSPGTHTLQPLLRQMNPVIQNQVNKWSGAIARPVLEAKARQLALEAFDTYNPNAGAALATHLTNRLMKLSREVYTHQDAVRLPEYRKLRVHSFLRAEKELLDQFGREPTQVELADHLGWSSKMLGDVQRSLNPELVTSQDTGAGLFETQSVWGSGTDDALVDLVYFDLDPIDKQIFEYTTGYGGKPQLNATELCRRVGITQGQLSYRKRKIVDQFKKLQDK